MKLSQEFKEALESVSPSVKKAFELSDAALTKAGIPHVVIGGLAVNIHGHHYSTKDVDYLVSAKDAFNGDVVLTHKPGVPFSVNGVDIDYIVEDGNTPELIKREMRSCLEAASEWDSPVVASPELLVWMKLKVGRTKDLAAVEGLLQAGMNEQDVRSFLSSVGDQKVIKLFDRCVEAAGDE